MSFHVRTEKYLLDRLAALSQDGDRNERISEGDLNHPKAKGILKKLVLDDDIIGNLSDKAARLSEDYAQVRLASALFLDHGQRTPDSSLRFYHWESYEKDVARAQSLDDCSLRMIQTMNGKIIDLLGQAFPDATPDSEIFFAPNASNTSGVLRKGRPLRISQAILDEFRQAYDAKTEQFYLLLAHRKTAVIEKVLRPRHREGDHHCGVEDGWVDYVSSVLSLTPSPYIIVGDYHSHPGLQSKGYAGYGPSGDDAPQIGDAGALLLIGHAETEDRGSPEFEKSFQVNAYDRKGRKVPIAAAAGAAGDIFLDADLQDADPFVRGHRTITLSREDFERVSLGLFWKETEFIEAAARVNEIPLTITLYYDDTYTFQFRVGSNPTARLNFSYRPHYRHWENELTGRFDLGVVVDYAGMSLPLERLVSFMPRLHGFLAEKLSVEQGTTPAADAECPFITTHPDGLYEGDRVLVEWNGKREEGTVRDVQKERGEVEVLFPQPMPIGGELESMLALIWDGTSSYQARYVLDDSGEAVRDVHLTKRH